MKINILFVVLFQLIFLTASITVYSQTNHSNQLLRIYEDNDFFNIRGKGTDRAYSGGTRIDLFYIPKKKPFRLPALLAPEHDGDIYMASWGVMQTVYTPTDIQDPYFQAGDYFYSGALFATHSVYLYNPKRHQSIQTEIELGVRGPAALGKQSQTFVHQLIHYKTPKGWDNQLQNSPIINVNITYEKELVQVNKSIEFIGGIKTFTGTLQNGIAVYPMFRFGIMNPYFTGYINQFSGMENSRVKRKNKMQAYLIIKPQVQWVLSNASLQGGVFAKKPSVKLNNSISATSPNEPDRSANIIRNWVYAVSYGAVISNGKFALSFIQNSSTATRKNTYSHEVGNVSLYFIL